MPKTPIIIEATVQTANHYYFQSIYKLLHFKYFEYIGGLIYFGCFKITSLFLQSGQPKLQLTMNHWNQQYKLQTIMISKVFISY